VTKDYTKNKVMEEVLAICFYGLFCCELCEEEKKPISSDETKITVNPAVTGDSKGSTVKNEP